MLTSDRSSAVSAVTLSRSRMVCNVTYVLSMIMQNYTNVPVAMLGSNRVDSSPITWRTATEIHLLLDLAVRSRRRMQKSWVDKLYGCSIVAIEFAFLLSFSFLIFTDMEREIEKVGKLDGYQVINVSQVNSLVSESTVLLHLLLFLILVRTLVHFVSQ